MNVTTNVTNSLSSSIGFQNFQQFLSKLTIHSPETSTTRQQKSQQHKPFTGFEKLEICFLCLILVEHTIIFLLTFHKKSKKTLINNDNQQTHSRPIILPSKSLLYNCLHRNWIRAYSFSNFSLSSVYFVNLFLKHYHPSLVHHSSITFYSLPLTLVQQILINFHTFHLLIISISVLQYFIRYYRLLKNKYSLNIYNGRNLLITKHTNVALILSGSLALIFAYNYIFYTPKNTQTMILLPLITLNMILLPLIDLTIFILIFLCCFLNLSSSTNFSSEHPTQQQQQQQQQRLTEGFRSTIEKMTCVKCYSKFLQQNRTILQDTDPYTKLHTRFFTENLLSSTRPSITPSEERRKYSTISYENFQTMHNVHAHLRASYPCQTVRSLFSNKTLISQQDLSSEQRFDLGQNSTNEILLQTVLIQLKHKNHSFCHLCYQLLLIFLFKYVLLTFPQHYIQMNFHLKQFFEYILKLPTTNNHHQHFSNEYSTNLIRLIFLVARFGDCLLLTRLPNFIRNYFPCWCRFNSRIFREEKSFQRASHQILMRNTDSSINEPASNEDFAIGNENNHQKIFKIQNLSRRNTRQFRLRFQFVPIWSKKRPEFIRENS